MVVSTLTEANALSWRDGASGRFGPVRIGPVAFPQEEIVAFARRYDPQPFHIDADAARSSLLGGLVASGWQTSARMMALVDRELGKAGVYASGYGVEEMLWSAPVRPGDSLTGHISYAGDHPCPCGGRLLKLAMMVANQNGDRVMHWLLDCAIGERPDWTAGHQTCCAVACHRPARPRRRPIDRRLKGFDEIQEGEEINLGAYRFTADDMAAYDEVCPDAHRTEADAASRNHRRGLVQPWHLVAAWMTSMVRYYQTQAAALQSKNIAAPQLGPAAGVKHLRWAGAVKSGDMISFRAWAERKLALGSRPAWGLLVVGAEGVNADGTIVVSFYSQMLLERVRVAPLAVGMDGPAHTP